MKLIGCCELCYFINWVTYTSIRVKWTSSLVTIAAPTRRTRSSRNISLVTPKANSSLAAFPSSSLLPMTGTNCKNHWSSRPISPSPALSTSCQSSSQITAPVHSPSVNSPSIFPTSSPYCIYLFILLLCTPVSLLAHSSSAHSAIPVFNCYFVITLPPWPIYCIFSLTSFAHAVYRFFYRIIDFMSVYSMCNSVVVCVELLCFILARLQL